MSLSPPGSILTNGAATLTGDTYAAVRDDGAHSEALGVGSTSAGNARSATLYFGIPPDRVVELGMQIDL